MQSNLSLVSKIQKMLEDIRYPDAYRISFEIEEFLSKNTDITLENISKRLEKGEPWEYIQGYTTFCDSKFNVNRDVLIPRIESEQLVLDVTKYIRESSIENVIDVGTGSGCIAISIAKLIEKDLDIYATDVSESALEVARNNEMNILNQKSVRWLNTDLIKDIPDISSNTLLVANLPYIPTSQYLGLDDSVREYEPRIALDGGENGLLLFERLITQIREKSLKLEALFFETETSIFDSTVKFLEESFPHYEVDRKKDVFERNRFVYLFRK